MLDICSGEGGTSHGLAEAGFDVYGLDNNPACEAGYMRSGGSGFFARDALEALEDTQFMAQFDGVIAGPPCQYRSRMSNCRPGLAATYPRLIGPIRRRLVPLGLPFVIENVDGARKDLIDPVTLCTWMFGLPGYRHRLFEPGGGLTLTAPIQPASAEVIQLNAECGWSHPVAAAKAGHWKPGMFVSVAGHERKAAVRSVMEIDWMSNREAVKEAIPVRMAYEIGRQMHKQMAA